MQSLLTYVMLIKEGKLSASSIRCVTTGANSGKAEKLFFAIDSTVKNDGVNWDNVVSIGLDNTNSTMGIRSSIKLRILEKYLWLVVAAI